MALHRGTPSTETTSGMGSPGVVQRGGMVPSMDQVLLWAPWGTTTEPDGKRPCPHKTYTLVGLHTDTVGIPRERETGMAFLT